MSGFPEIPDRNEEIKIDLVSIENGLSEGKVVEAFPTEVDLKIGQQLRFFVDNRTPDKRFIKMFKGSITEAESEIANVRKLSMVSNGVEIVTPLSECKKADIITVCYPYIDGHNLQLVLEQLKGKQELLPVAMEAVRQTAELSRKSELIDLKDYTVAPKFLISYPFPEDVFGGGLFAEVNDAYVPFWVLRGNICKIFPGYSLDRHSRNIIVGNEDGKMRHIDFEVVTRDSPFFDFVKITRNGPDGAFPLSKEKWVDAISNPRDAFFKLNPFSEAEENEILEFFMSERFPSYGNDIDSFTTIYETVSAHTHLSYIRKYLRRYNVASSDAKSVAEARLHYHVIGYLALADKLSNVTELNGDRFKGISNSVTVDQILRLNKSILELTKNFIDQNAK